MVHRSLLERAFRTCRTYALVSMTTVRTDLRGFSINLDRRSPIAATTTYCAERSPGGDSFTNRGRQTVDGFHLPKGPLQVSGGPGCLA